MEKKIVLVTGATDGIGKEAARALAKQNFKVILHGRNEEKAKSVEKEIKEEYPEADIDIMLADLLSFKNVKKLAESVIAKYDHLDVLINNAGAIFSKERVLTEDNEERTYQLNVFSPFLLSYLLLPLIQKSKSGRIIYESSIAHLGARRIDLDDMKSEKSYGAFDNYSRSKLYGIWMARQFIKYMKEKGITNVTYNIAHPGASATNFGKNVDKGFFINLGTNIATLFMITSAEGAKSEIYLATSPEVEGKNGLYINPKCKEEKISERLWTEENERKIWEYCMNTCKNFM